MMKINPYTGEPLPMNQYMPVKLEPGPKIEPIDLNINKLATTPIPETDVSQIGTDVMEKGTDVSGGLTDKLMGNAGGALNFGMQEFANFSNVAQSNKESNAQRMGSTMSGAALGMKVGGPVGALAGGLIGYGLGTLDKKKDQGIRAEKYDKDHREMLTQKKDERKKAYYGSQGNRVSGDTTIDSNEKYYNPYGN